MTTLETNAKRAKESYSYFDYKNGTATAEYLTYCKNAEEVAEKTIKRLEKANAPKDRIEKVNYLLEKYKIKKLEWLNSLYTNRASCPSVMITGGSNFPIQKKQKQIEREIAIMNNDPEYLIEKIKSINYNANTIYSDDKNAAERIKNKISELEKGKYNSAEIMRLKERLLTLAPNEFKEEQEKITVNGLKTYKEIVGIWNTGIIFKDNYSNISYYKIPLIFNNGKRNYKSMLSIRLDENGNYLKYDYKKGEYVVTNLDDEDKYNLIIDEIRGSGNKLIMYKYLESLSPKIQEMKKRAEDMKENGETEMININGEPAEVVRNIDVMRLQLIFEDKPNTETRNILKSNGFKWSPKFKAWQRLLNDNAEYKLKIMQNTN